VHPFSLPNILIQPRSTSTSKPRPSSADATSPHHPGNPTATIMLLKLTCDLCLFGHLRDSPALLSHSCFPLIDLAPTALSHNHVIHFAPFGRCHVPLPCTVSLLPGLPSRSRIFDSLSALFCVDSSPPLNMGVFRGRCYRVECDNASRPQARPQE
jgi:hypothetical protein